MTQKILWFIFAGTVAGVLTLLASGSDGFFTGAVIRFPFGGLLFATIVTFTIVLQVPSFKSNSISGFRYFVAVVVLALGLPAGLITALAADNLLNNGGLGLLASNTTMSIVLSEIAAAAVWALCLTSYLRILTHRWQSSWFLQAWVLAVATFAVAYATDEATNLLWNKSSFIPLFVVGQLVVSTVFLGLAAMRWESDQSRLQKQPTQV